MTLVRSTRTTFLFVSIAGGVFSGSAAAQSSAVSPAVTSPAFSVSAGAFHYDLSGVGTAPMVAVRADFPLGRTVLVEGSLGVARPEQQVGDRSTMMIPEAQLQVQLPLGRVLPYVGAGGGAALDFRSNQAGGLESDITGSVAGGLRAWLTERAGIRAELRVRGIGSGFEGAADEWTAGLTWRF